MADHGVVIGWSEVITGRERQAEKVIGEAIAYFTDLVARGSAQGLRAALTRLWQPALSHPGDPMGALRPPTQKCLAPDVG
jgi:hypothetical protein